MTRREMLRNSLLMAGLLGLQGSVGPGLGGALARAAQRREPLGPAVVHGQPSACQPNQAIEAATRVHLNALQNALRRQLAAGDQADQARMQVIRLSMQEPLADLSNWFIATLGDEPWARAVFAPTLPLVHWLCAQFLLLLDVTGDGQDVPGQTNEIFDFMARLRRQNMGVSIDNVGDAALSAETARDYNHFYLALIERFAADRQAQGLNVSLKLSALVHQLDVVVNGRPSAALDKRQEILRALGEIVHRANATPGKRVFVRLDMEEYAYKNFSLEIFKELVESNLALVRNGDGSLNVGVVIQAYLRDSADDLAAMARWGRSLGVKTPVRLVKGAYEKYEKDLVQNRGVANSPVWNYKTSTDANYEALSEYLLLTDDVFRPAFGTHNIRTMAHVMAVTEGLAAKRPGPEFQMLHGMGDPIKKVLVSAGRRMRVYVPTGSLFRGLKYAGRRFQELASGDNALARTMRGDFSVVDGGAPLFMGEQDMADGARTLELLRQARLESGIGSARAAWFVVRAT